jgi:hypothetical protein
MRETLLKLDSYLATFSPVTAALNGVTSINGDFDIVISGNIGFGQNTITTKTASAMLVSSDANSMILMNVASANTLTVPSNASQPMLISSRVDIAQLGGGQTSVVAGPGVTIRTAIGLKMRAQYSTATLLKIDTDTWLLVGDLSA